MRKKVIGSILGSVIVVLVGALWFYHVIKERNDQTYLTLYGNVDIRDVQLAFRVPGRLLAMEVEEGDTVQAGQVIARLEQDTFKADLASAKAQLIQALATRKNAMQTYQRRSNLVGDGAVSKALYDDAIAMKDSSEADISVAKANLEKAQIALRDTEIHAPTQGTILTRIQEPGAIVHSSEPIYTMAIENPVWVRVYVDEPSLGSVFPGQKAWVYTDSNPKKPYKGHVGFISPQAEFTPKTVETTQLRTDLVYRLRVVINQPNHGLRQGMPVTVKIDLKEKTAS